MTRVIVLMLGTGVVLIVSSIETDPKTGKSVSILQTVSDIWNNNLPGTSSAGAGAGQAPAGGTPSNPGGPGGQVPQFGSGGSANYGAYQAAVTQAYVQSQR